LKHGIFEQKASRHLSGSGCRKCSFEKSSILKRYTLNDFILSSREKHGDKYSYDKAVYNGTYEKLIITCPIHGDFEQRPNDHSNGYGCPKCGREKTIVSSTYTQEEVLDIFKNIHGNKYNYSNVYYKKASIPIEIICPIHGPFLQKPSNHMDGCGCPSCSKSKVTSSYEDFILNYLDSHLDTDDFLINSRPDFLEKKELDIYSKEHNVAIEFNGLRWHNEKYKDKWYHFKKSEICRENNVKLLQIWEHYWLNPVKKKIYLSKINHLFNLDEKVYARKCHIEEIDLSSYRFFVENNHLDGYVLPYRNMKYIGLFYLNKMVMVAGYGMFYSQGSKCFIPKLQRICTVNGMTVVGGVSKLLRFIKRDENYKDILFQITLDTGGSLLLKNKIKQSNVTLRYWWTKSSTYKTRNECQVSILNKKDDWQKNDTEKSYMERNGWTRLWDSGICSIKI